MTTKPTPEHEWPNGPPPDWKPKPTNVLLKGRVETWWTKPGQIGCPTTQAALAKEIEKWCTVENSTYTDSRDAEIADLKAKLASAEHEAVNATKLALMCRVERDQAIAERNMVLRAYVAAIEAKIIDWRDEEAEREAKSPGARALAAIGKHQDGGQR